MSDISLIRISVNKYIPNVVVYRSRLMLINRVETWVCSL